MSNNKPSKIALLALATSGCFTSVAGATDFTFSGYATVGVGKVLSGDKHTFYNRECPCYIANFPDVGVYDQSMSFNPDSRFGVQATAQVDDQTNFTAQISGQGGNNFTPQVDWAYISHDLSNTLTLQAGRKRLPIYQYSDFANVGYAYPWIRPPSDLYGWQIVNYNGANLLYRNAIGSVGVRANAWAGREDDPNNRMLGQLYYNEKIEESWKNIFGAYAEFTFDVFSVRATYMNNVVDRYGTDASGVRTHITPNVRQRFMGLAFNADWHNIVVKSELNRFERPSVPDNYTSSLVGVGYRIGDVLPMLTYSRFTEGYGPDPTQDEIHHTWTGSVRWDVRPNMAVKLQYDQFTDKSHFTPFAGNSKVLAASVDLIF